jgi:NAD(P)-dependent dehydrogenase (short-subunit alcohol dehydrogenase family)
MDTAHTAARARGAGARGAEEGAAAAAASDGFLRDTVALITAGGGGIGGATARLFAQQGARVAVADVNAEAAARVAGEIEAAGGQALALSGDALAAADCARVVRETEARFGRLDVLVNLVGLFGRGGGGNVDAVALDEWDMMIDINLKSVFLMSKHAIPALLRAGGGAIVNTGTLAAVIGRPGSVAYGASKSGVLALTRAMAADYFKQGIRVNCVCPSGTDTPMYMHSALRRGATREEIRQTDQGLSTPDEIAASFLFLASDRLSRRVTGHILMADNGFSEFRF